jgi:hypothetical protein
MVGVQREAPLHDGVDLARVLAVPRDDARLVPPGAPRRLALRPVDHHRVPGRRGRRAPVLRAEVVPELELPVVALAVVPVLLLVVPVDARLVPGHPLLDVVPVVHRVGPVGLHRLGRLDEGDRARVAHDGVRHEPDLHPVLEAVPPVGTDLHRGTGRRRERAEHLPLGTPHPGADPAEQPLVAATRALPRALEQPLQVVHGQSGAEHPVDPRIVEHAHVSSGLAPLAGAPGRAETGLQRQSAGGVLVARRGAEQPVGLPGRDRRRGEQAGDVLLRSPDEEVHRLRVPAAPDRGEALRLRGDLALQGGVALQGRGRGGRTAAARGRAGRAGRRRARGMPMVVQHSATVPRRPAPAGGVADAPEGGISCPIGRCPRAGRAATICTANGCGTPQGSCRASVSGEAAGQRTCAGFRAPTGVLGQVPHALHANGRCNAAEEHDH